MKTAFRHPQPTEIDSKLKTQNIVTTQPVSWALSIFKELFADACAVTSLLERMDLVGC
jgi:hypothetical protein